MLMCLICRHLNMFKCLLSVAKNKHVYVFKISTFDV